MNERINKLFGQAMDQSIPENWTTLTHSQLSILKDKFAELIVKECLDIALEVRGEPATDTHYVIGYDRACEKMIDAIKESYGVEE